MLLVVKLTLTKESNGLIVGIGEDDEPRLRACLAPLEVVTRPLYHVPIEAVVGLTSIRLRSAHVVKLVVKQALLLEELMVWRP